ncbi:epsin [Klebsormidium nitens]|uniref:Epsin n=1 Tax=Klebsormidium nitens TaxID=105231 RepID=A0A1Y1IEN4_KLENI|nr:epsin [Klebsormidium nitens]|eukprot:GAQ89405.1 epsin [Klebsormidium nitens]
MKSFLKTAKSKVTAEPAIVKAVKNATNSEPWGPLGSQMKEIANATCSCMDYPRIMNTLLERLEDEPRNWRKIYKALILLEFLCTRGVEQVHQDLKEHVDLVNELKSSFKFEEPGSGKDLGQNVRLKASALSSLIVDDARVAEERAKYRDAEARLFQASSPRRGPLQHAGSLPGPLSRHDAPQKLPKSEDGDEDAAAAGAPAPLKPQTSDQDKSALMGPHRRTKSEPAMTLLYCPGADEGPEGPKPSNYLQGVRTEGIEVRPKDFEPARAGSMGGDEDWIKHLNEELGTTMQVSSPVHTPTAVPFPVSFPDHSQHLPPPHPPIFTPCPATDINSQTAQYNPRSDSIQTLPPNGTKPPAPMPSSAYRSSSPVANVESSDTPRRQNVFTNPFLNLQVAGVPPADSFERSSTPNQALQSPPSQFPSAQIESPAPVYPTAHQTGPHPSPTLVAPSPQPQSPGIARQNSASIQRQNSASIQRQNSASPTAFRRLSRQNSGSPTAFAAAQFQHTPAVSHHSPSPVAFDQSPGTPRHASAPSPFGQPLAPVATRFPGQEDAAAKRAFATGPENNFGANPFASANKGKLYGLPDTPTSVLAQNFTPVTIEWVPFYQNGTGRNGTAANTFHGNQAPSGGLTFPNPAPQLVTTAAYQTSAPNGDKGCKLTSPGPVSAEGGSPLAAAFEDIFLDEALAGAVAAAGSCGYLLQKCQNCLKYCRLEGPKCEQHMVKPAPGNGLAASLK